MSCPSVKFLFGSCRPCLGEDSLMLQYLYRLTSAVLFWFVTLAFQTLTLWPAPLYAAPEEVEVTILHTNDLHSQFREKAYPIRIGGIARLNTAIRAIRKTHPQTTLVDGGDWSEGSIYYTLGAGLESIQMLDRMGYDFAVLGNHDFLNGPDILLDALGFAKPRTRFLAKNLSIPDSYPRKKEFEQAILPYQIQDYGGFKIAWIGMTTYEFIYDKYLEPIQITNPFTAAANLARKLKSEEKVDGVVVISHNSIKTNELILRAANEFAGQNQIDLIIGAHDHKKLSRPHEVKSLRGGPPAWIVETGSGGEYLGQVTVKLSAGHMELQNYQLIQMDAKIPEDPETLEWIKQLDHRVEAKYGSVFDEEIGKSEIDFSGMGVENLMGDWVTDCYRKETGSHLSIESNRFISHPILPGTIHSYDLFNAAPPIYNPKTGLTWTLRTFPIRGNTLKWLLYLLFGTKKLSNYGLINVSGLKLKYDPLFATAEDFDPDEPNNLALDLQNLGGNRFIGIEGIPVVKDIQIFNPSTSEYLPLKESSNYTVATGGGLIESIQWLNSKLGKVIPLDELRDTEKENWRVLADQVRATTPLTRENVTVGDRIQTAQSNLGVYPIDITWVPKAPSATGWTAEVRAKIRNYGSSRSHPGPQVRLLLNKNRSNLSIEPDYIEDPLVYELKLLEPGEFQELVWNVTVPKGEESFPVTVRIFGIDEEVNTTNHEATVWLMAVNFLSKK